jgi:hypothetical protein
MRRILAVLSVAFAFVVVHPPRAAAQCNEACVSLTAPDGTRGFGCVVDNDANAACWARSTRCTVKPCSNALLTDPAGRVLATADICNGQVTVHPVPRDRAQRRAGRSLRTRESARVAVASARAAVRLDNSPSHAR